MSYDIAVLATDIATTDAQAWLELDALTEQRGKPPPVFRQIHDIIIARYPDITTLSDEAADDGVWSSGPLWNNFSPAAAVLALRHSRADEVVPFVVETARSLGLPVFDWTTRHIHRPNGIADLELTLEDRFPHFRPTLQQVLDAARSLIPDGGPGFLILDRAGSRYIQVAGGKGAYAVEWRQYDGTAFKHYAAGLLHQNASTEIQIPTNGFHVTVKANERLSLKHVEILLSAFATGDAKPPAFTWRDITSRFR